MTDSPVDAFVRQRTLAGFGGAGQRALGGARVAMVGLGGLGCPAAMYLAAAGVGRLTLIDADHVSITNLHRQILYGPDDVGQPKVGAAREALLWIAPQAAIEPVATRVTADNAQELLAGYDVIVDGTDTFGSRMVIADAARALGIPVAWGAVQGWDGQVTVFDESVGLRDIFPEEPALDLERCDAGPVLGTLCGQVGAAMATEVVKLISGVGEPLVGRLSVLDGRTGRWRDIMIEPSSPQSQDRESPRYAHG